MDARLRVPDIVSASIVKLAELCPQLHQIEFIGKLSSVGSYHAMMFVVEDHKKLVDTFPLLSNVSRKPSRTPIRLSIAEFQILADVRYVFDLIRRL